MVLTVKFIGALRQLSGKPQLIANFQQGMSLEDLLDTLRSEIPQLTKVFSEHQLSDSNSNALVLINGREISVLNGFETKLGDNDEIVFIPVVHGG